MPKRVSERTHIINFAMSATEEGLTSLVETVRAIAANRFPKTRAAGAAKTKIIEESKAERAEAATS